MIINRINTNNNFSAKIGPNLANELKHKYEATKPTLFSMNTDRVKNYAKSCQQDEQDLFEAGDLISKIARNAEVDITRNSNSYKISIDGDTFYTSRGKDKNSYKYESLIKKLNYFDK